MPRRLGQHFLVRASVIHRIVHALELKPEDRLLEIGPGRGALTAALIQPARPMLLVEKDERLADEMRTRLAGQTQVQVKSGDFLKLPWAEITQFLGEHFKVVSNLPYEAATAILIRLLRHTAPGTAMVLMFQKEVGDRLLAEPGCKDYGSLTIFCRLYATVKSVLEVPPLAFRPPPKVRSLVLKLRKREQSLVALESMPAFESLTQSGFAHRRKMLRQNLRGYFNGESAAQIEARLEQVGAKPTARAEELSVEQWLALFKAPVLA